jgi:hypothetical protein
MIISTPIFYFCRPPIHKLTGGGPHFQLERQLHEYSLSNWLLAAIDMKRCMLKKKKSEFAKTKKKN